NRHATLIAGLAALLTAGATPEAGTELFHRKTDLGKIVARIIDHFDKVGTNCAYQPLCDERLHDRRQQERFHVHVQQARDAAYSVVRVQRAENKVTSHGRANRDVRGFDITNFPDHHNVGVLSQNMTKTFCEGQIDLRFHIDLRNTRNSIFDRFFDGNDAALDGIDTAEKAIKGSRFAAAGRAGQKNDPVRLRQEMANDLFLLLTQIEAPKIEFLLAPTEQSQTDRFAVNCWNCRDAY